MTFIVSRKRSLISSRRAVAYTLVEVMVAMTIATMVIGSALAFISYAGKSISGITAQCNQNEQAAITLHKIQSCARIATSVSNDVNGMTLIFGFDDNYMVDSNADGMTYNDTDHVEKFQVIGSSTNIQSSTNSLIYIGKDKTTNVLIPTGVCRLPGQNIFSITNVATALIRFAIVDSYSRDNYQAIDVQSTAVIMNRRYSTNTIAILP